jgi:catechol 2,3-dioxygenase-like lactoylglutathione lyase family enzyme
MKIHHIAIICSDYQISKNFYTEILGLNIIREVYREERQSYKLDLAIGDDYVIEFFRFQILQKTFQTRKLWFETFGFCGRKCRRKTCRIITKRTQL